MEKLFYFVLRTSNISQLYRKINNFDSFKFLMADNHVHKMSPALDKSNSSMANQIVYSPKETILRRTFLRTNGAIIMKLNGVRLYCVNLLWCFGALSTANVISERPI